MEVDMDSEGRLNQLRELSQKGENEEAIKVAQECLQAEPANIEALILLAECNARLSRFAQAREAIEKALKIELNNIWALKALAVIYRDEAEQSDSPDRRQELLNLARDRIEQALRLNPSDAWTNAEAALIYLSRGEKEEASKSIEKALSLQAEEAYFKGIKLRIESSP
jgi:Flp pilus assembly protein TadD